MNGEGGRWDFERLRHLTLAQLSCLVHKDPPGAATELTTMAELEDALEEIDREDREWYQ